MSLIPCSPRIIYSVSITSSSIAIQVLGERHCAHSYEVGIRSNADEDGVKRVCEPARLRSVHHSGQSISENATEPVLLPLNTETPTWSHILMAATTL